MEYGGPEQLVATHEAPEPVARPNDVTVDVHAASFNPFDAKMRMGFLKGFFPVELPAVLGCDFAGVVRAVGPEARTDLRVGDAVYGLQHPQRPGSYAATTVVEDRLVRALPRGLTMAQAASVPMAALTAWRGLVHFAAVPSGARVLVHGGAGGVGSAAVQIARSRGCRVAATCSRANVAFVESLGADEVIDYESEDFAARVAPVDVVFDPIGGDVNRRSYAVLKRGGTMLVVLRADPVEEQHRKRMEAEHGVRTHVVADIIRPDILDELRPLLEDGRLRPVVTAERPLEDVPRVHAECVTGLGRTGHARGKTALLLR
jgi:NADPH:quinone reductase-like Zn-dependent oxidoreductase